MKKILLTSTFLAIIGGMAAAEVTLKGGARFGLVYNSGNAGGAGAEKAQLHNRFTLNIDGTASTDAGADFFARVRIRGGNTGNGATAGSAVSAPRVGVSFGGLTVAVGNINGALESMPGLYSGAVGLTGLGWFNVAPNLAPAGAFAWDSFSSGGGGANGVEVIYSAGDLGVHLSHSETGSTRTAINASYGFGDWTAAVGFQSSDAVGEDITIVTLGGSLGDFGIGAAYSMHEGDNDAARLSASYSLASGTTITGFATLVSTTGLDNAFGLGFNHSLGGASLKGGVVRDTASNTRADIGVSFSF